MDDLSDDAKIELIESNLQETIGGHVIRDVIKKQKRPLVIYWGTATTGRPHVAYFVPIVKLADFLRAGCVVKILLADVHGFLDNLKAPITLVEYRAKYYKYVIMALLKAVGVPIERLEFVLGSSYQRSPEYVMDLYRMMTVVTERDAKKAGAEVVKQVESPFVSGLIYPLMQALDEEYLKVDCQFGGVDQRRIFALATEQMPKLNFKPRAHLMNAMVPGLAGGKMSSSDPDSKIDVLDNPEVVRKKLKKAYAVAKEVEGNGIIGFVEHVLLPVSRLKFGEKGRFVVEKREGEGEPLIYEDIESLKEDYKADKVTPQLLKPAVAKQLIALLEPIQTEFNASAEWQDIEKAAYPPPEASGKKAKRVKDKGSKHPASTKGVEAKPDGHVEGELKDVVSLGTGAEAQLENLDIEVNEK